MPEYNESKPPKALVKRKETISAIWLVPIIALIFGGWLLVKAYLERGILISVQFDNARGIVIGKTEVRYKGLTTGIVKDIDVSDDLQSVIVEIEMVANASKMLTDKTVFWYVTADVSFQGISGLDTLFSGSYINIQPDFTTEGKAQRHFIASKEPPMLDQSTPGLHISLLTDSLGSLAKNSPVTFKQITVGHVSGFKYSAKNNKVEVGVFIEPQYAHLVKENARFWNASGFDVTGSLAAGVRVHSESLASIIAGGIAFDQPNFSSGESIAHNGQQFTLYENFQSAEMGHEIELELNWNSGIDTGASIRYQGLTVGKVITLKKIDADQRKIIARARINPRLVPYLTTEAQFYVVSPQLSLAGVTNMHSLITGPHIGIHPSTLGQLNDRFIVYNQKPPYSYSEPGLHLMLTTSDISSLKIGTGIFYQQQQVGSVQAIEQLTSEQALVHIHIEPQYQHFVSANSNFWNISGLSIKGNIQGVDIQAQSLQTMLSGGIAFDHGDSQQVVQNGDTFPLAINQQRARQNIKLTLLTKEIQGISENMRLLYKDKLIGSVHQINKTTTHLQLNIGIYEEFADILRENTHFWLVNPEISLAGLSDLQALLGGSYILVDAGDGAKTTTFNLSPQPVAKHPSAAGLQLSLSTTESHGVLPGSLITYKGLSVGQVDTVALNPSGQEVNFTVTISDEFAHLVNHYTRFYQTSGVSIQGNITNFAVQTDSLDSVLKGGLSFYTPAQHINQPSADEGQHFTLFADRQQAEMAGIGISIHFNDINGIKVGQFIRFQGQAIGRVERIMFDKQGTGATVFGYLSQDSEKFAVAGAKYWHVSPKLSLINSSKLSKLIEGDFIQVLPGDGSLQTHFNAEDMPPAITTLGYGLNITLSAQQLASIRVGNPVLYRQVVVGQVIGVDLAPSADQVNIYINIAQRYAPLVTPESKFWNISGFEIDAGLFSGINIDSASMETLLSGGIAFATPPTTSKTSNTPTTFTLHEKAKPQWLNWAPKIPLK